jgi:hypothetical protein
MAFVYSMWLGGACLALGGTMIVAWALLRYSGRLRRRPTRLEPDWRLQAEALERRAEHAEAVVRSGLLPALARLLRSRFVLGLVSQRAELLQAQVDSTGKVSELEQRLVEAHSKVQDRLGQYEQRIAELQQKEEPPPPAPARPLPRTEVSPGFPRRNPLGPPSKQAEPSPVQFRDIMARKRGSGGVRPGS